MSVSRVLTTHTGSLPRPPDVAGRVFAAADRGAWQPSDEAALAEAVAEIVARQRQIGLDIVTDGEITRLRYWDVFSMRLDGIDPFAEERVPSTREGRFAGYAQPVMRPPGYPDPAERLARHPVVRGPIAYKGPGDLALQVRFLRAAVPAVDDAFITAPAPALISDVCGDQFYRNEEQLVMATADALADEYRFIVDSGFVLQVDSPDLPSCWKGRSAAEGRQAAELHLDALQHALRGLPLERVRMHVCWGNTEAPHDDDIELRAFADLLVSMPVGAIVLEAANPRHAHEWRCWRDVPLGDKKLVVGVIDTTTNFVEHPDLVADRICQFASVVGTGNVIAGTDCGFGTWAHHYRVDPRIAWAKLESLVEGARRATQRIVDGLA
jgi:5-methyltetrahydropteroyltriglutamate--homocysteine methyltransferase